ncbi:hypothetical protein [Comamonas sp. UBA7528]|uniref:hypothetical protein n=1 Tax=Comamonas sp. UBA7528 TaxID=1946391 RepID=UPI0025C28642|nr:hypothetical protein [Comamonas sp. UBA7528]
MHKNKDGRLIAKSNEVRVLRGLQRFGWLRTKDLAALCWTNWENRVAGELLLAATPAKPSSIRMAQRTLQRLRHKRSVLCAKAPDGSTIYSLSEAGASSLRDLGLQAQSGKDLTRSFSSSFFRHRCIANEIAISALLQGFRISTEREIAQGRWCGGEKGFWGKRPDVIVRDGSRVLFIEVERSRKNFTDYRFLLNWLEKLLRAQINGRPLIGEEKLSLEKIIFICTQAFRSKLQKDLFARGWSTTQQSDVIIASTELYVFQDIFFHNPR